MYKLFLTLTSTLFGLIWLMAGSLPANAGCGCGGSAVSTPAAAPITPITPMAPMMSMSGISGINVSSSIGMKPISSISPVANSGTTNPNSGTTTGNTGTSNGGNHTPGIADGTVGGNPAPTPGNTGGTIANGSLIPAPAPAIIPATPTAIATNPVNAGTQSRSVVGTGGSNVSNPVNPNVPNAGGSSGFNSPVSGQAFQIQQRLSTAQTAYETASAKLAQAQTANPAASAETVRYARSSQDIASCGCVNPDTASTGNAELAAAQAEEAAAATELSNAKAEARQFLDAVKNTPTLQAGTTGYSPIW